MENLSKIFEAIKKFLAKEFLWGLAVLLVAFILASITKLLFNALYERNQVNGVWTLENTVDIDNYADTGDKILISITDTGDISFNNDITVTENESFLILIAFYIVFIYFVRLVVNAIKTVKKEKE